MYTILRCTDFSLEQKVRAVPWQGHG